MINEKAYFVLIRPVFADSVTYVIGTALILDLYTDFKFYSNV